jgi:hypothetical protein
MADATYAVVDKSNRLVLDTFIWDAAAHPGFVPVYPADQVPNGFRIQLAGALKIGDTAP